MDVGTAFSLTSISFPGGCGLCQAAGLQGSGRAGREVCHSHSRERQPGAGHCGVVDAPSGKDEPQTLASFHRFRANEARFQLSLLAYNLGNPWRRLVLPKRIEALSLTSLQQRLVKIGNSR
jgi:hypothetical protein